MKSSRFILNSDFATTKNDAEGKVMLSIPDEVLIYANQPNKVYSAEVEIGASQSAGIRTYLTTTRSESKGAIVGSTFFLFMPIEDCSYGEKSYYQGQVYGSIYRSGKKIRIEVTFPTGGSTESSDYIKYYGRNQILTLYVQTFIDPFEV